MGVSVTWAGMRAAAILLTTLAYLALSALAGEVREKAGNEDAQIGAIEREPLLQRNLREGGKRQPGRRKAGDKRNGAGVGQDGKKPDLLKKSKEAGKRKAP